MCRLFGWAAPDPTAAGDLLGADTARLRGLSHLHADGWGAAWSDGAEIHSIREEVPAHTSAQFDSAVHQGVGRLGLLHLRWATDGLSTCSVNTHPFVRDGVAFIHNGSIPRGPVLDELIDPDLAQTLEGDTDSERYFLAVLSAVRRTGSLPEAFARVVDALSGAAWPSLNAMWITGSTLGVLAATQPRYRAGDLPTDYYDLRYAREHATTMAWSTGVRHASGEVLPDRHLLLVDPLAGSSQLFGL
ncbi:MAG: class II glutamine amidotransferase [Actinomycetes bacterium]